MTEIIRYRGTYIGKVINGVFYTSRKESHVFHMYDSFNISTEVVNKVEKLGATRVEFCVSLNGKKEKYQVRIENIKRYEKYNNKGDIQWAIPINHLKGLHRESLQMTLDECFNSKGAQVV